MADDVPQNPMELREQLLARIKAIDEQMKALMREREAIEDDLEITDTFLNLWVRSSRLHLDVDHVTPVNGTRVGSGPVRTKPRNPPRDEVVRTVRDIITKADRAMSRSELYDALKARNIIIRGKDPVMVLSTMLWRSQDRIVRLKDHGYWLADKPYFKAGYYPGNEIDPDVSDTAPEGDEIEDPQYGPLQEGE